MSTRGLTALAAGALALGAAAGASAAPKGKAPVAELPPVTLTATLKEAGPDVPWVLELKNASSVPIKLADDARLIWLEVAVPSQPKPTVCRLPDDLVPKEPEKVRELQPGESLSHSFDGRFYCFGPKLGETLVPTAQVSPHYGYASKTKPRWLRGKRVEEKVPDASPFVAAPVAKNDSLGPAKHADGDPVVLDARYAAWSAPAEGAEDADDPPDEPVIDVSRGSDARNETNVTATVKIKNPTGHRLRLFFRRELVTFEVQTPRGPVECSPEPDARNPDRRAFTSVSPGSSFQVTSRLVELCERGTFAEPGLYLVHARLDASDDGAEFGLDAFTGTLHTSRPAPIRVRRALPLVRNRAVAGGLPPGQQLPPGMMMQPPQLNAAPVPPPPPPPPQ